MHQNREASDQGVDVVVSGAVGYPFMGDSGYRVVNLDDDGVQRKWHPLGDGLAQP